MARHRDETDEDLFGSSSVKIWNVWSSSSTGWNDLKEGSRGCGCLRAGGGSSSCGGAAGQVQRHQDGAVRARWDDASSFNADQDQRSAGSSGWLTSSLSKEDAVYVFSRRRLFELKVSKMMRFKFKRKRQLQELHRSSRQNHEDEESVQVEKD